MLYAVLFIQHICNYAGELWGTYSFFYVGKNEGKEMLFLFFCWKSVSDKQNVHFACQWAFPFVLSVATEEM